MAFLQARIQWLPPGLCWGPWLGVLRVQCDLRPARKAIAATRANRCACRVNGTVVLCRCSGGEALASWLYVGSWAGRRQNGKEHLARACSGRCIFQRKHA